MGFAILYIPNDSKDISCLGVVLSKGAVEDRISKLEIGANENGTDGLGYYTYVELPAIEE